MAPFFGDADLPALLADTGVPAVVNGVSMRCLFDERDDVELSVEGGRMIARGRPALFQTTAVVAAGIALDQAVTIDGVSYRVVAITRQNDGAETVVHVALP